MIGHGHDLLTHGSSQATGRCPARPNHLADRAGRACEPPRGSDSSISSGPSVEGRPSGGRSSRRSCVGGVGERRRRRRITQRRESRSVAARRCARRLAARGRRWPGGRQARGSRRSHGAVGADDGPVQGPAAGGVELAAAVERVDEHRSGRPCPGRGSGRACPTPGQRHADPPARPPCASTDSVIGMPTPPVEDLVEERVAGVVVVVAVPAEAPGGEEVAARGRRASAPGTSPARSSSRAERRRRRRGRVGMGGDAAGAASSSGDGLAAAVRPRADEPRRRRRPGPCGSRYRSATVAAYMSAGMYPGAHAATTPDKPAVVMAGHRRGRRPTPSSTPRPTGSRQLLPRRRPAARRPRRAAAWRTTPATSRSPGAPTTPASSTPPARSRLTAERAGLHRRRLRGQGLHHVARTRPTRRPRSCADTPGVRAAADARRHRSTGYDALRGRRRRPARRAARRTGASGTDMLYSSGTTGRPKGVKVAPPDAPLGDAPGARRRCSRCCSASTGDDGLPVAGAALPRRAAALLHGGPSRSAAPSW